MKSWLEIRNAVARRMWPMVSGYPPPPAPPVVPDQKKILPLSNLRFHPGHHFAEMPQRWAFPAYLDNPAVPWLATLKRLYASGISFPASVTPETGLLIHALIRNIRPRVVVETGTWIGTSTIWVAAALAENGDGGVIHTFDMFPPIRSDQWRDEELVAGRIETVRTNLEEAGVADRVVIHPGRSSYVIRDLRAELAAAGGVQFAFIDGDHTIPGICHDLWAVEPVLDTGGYLLLHDTFPDRCGGWLGPRHLADRINEIAEGVYQCCDICIAPANYGLALLRRVG
jgi:predicted O-methyltransferase YrrM